MPSEPNGKLLLVGLGPGDAIHQTPAATNALSECDVLVGYRGYIDQLPGSLQAKSWSQWNWGRSWSAAARAVDLACEGRSVAVVSSGDAGIYGMAGPMFRVLTDLEWDGCTRLRLKSSPASRRYSRLRRLLGAPLMQDFCAISLSNLLTPWEVIEKRLKAAALGDFVVVSLQPPQPAAAHGNFPKPGACCWSSATGKRPLVS